MDNYSTVEFNGMKLMVVPKSKGWFAIDSIDLSGISKAALTLAWQEAPTSGYLFELRLDSPEGRKIGEAVLNPPSGKQNAAMIELDLNTTIVKLSMGLKAGFHHIYVVSQPKDARETSQVAIQAFEFKSL